LSDTTLVSVDLDYFENISFWYA